MTKNTNVSNAIDALSTEKERVRRMAKNAFGRIVKRDKGVTSKMIVELFGSLVISRDVSFDGFKLAWPNLSLKEFNINYVRSILRNLPEILEVGGVDLKDFVVLRRCTEVREDGKERIVCTYEVSDNTQLLDLVTNALAEMKEIVNTHVALINLIKEHEDIYGSQAVSKAEDEWKDFLGITKSPRNNSGVEV